MFLINGRKTAGSAITGPVDLTEMMPSAPDRKMVDLSKMLLPTGPKLSRTGLQQPSQYSSYEEEYWLGVHIDQGGTEADYYALLQEEIGDNDEREEGEQGYDWWNNW